MHGTDEMSRHSSIDVHTQKFRCKRVQEVSSVFRCKKRFFRYRGRGLGVNENLSVFQERRLLHLTSLREGESTF